MIRIFTIIFTFIALNTICFSQYFYLPSSSNGNPGGLNTDSEYPSGSGLDASWNILLPPGNTTPTWSSIATIPFPFNFNGLPVSSYKVSSSGVLTFTTTATTVPGFNNATIPDPAIPDKSIMTWGIEGTGSNDAIATKVFGTSGSQQLWVFFSSFTAGSWTYWSIVLEEGSDKIYIVDQRHSSNANPQLTAGVQINNSTALMVAGSPSLSNLAGSDPTPADNHYYEFTYGSQNNTDISGIEVSTYPYQYINDAPYTITGIFRNLGTDSVSSMDINYSINGSNTITETVSNLNINTFENDTFNFNNTWNPTIDGTYDISIWASNINGNNDLNNINDTVHKLLHVFNTITTRKPMLETFVSSTSNYSVTGNLDLGLTLSANSGNYSLLKYPMSWPSPGDPYFTNEGGQRRYYYSINTVPRLVMNGVLQNNPIGFTQQEFDEAYNMYSYLDLSANYYVDDQNQTVNVDVNINSLCNTAGIWENLVLHTAVYEHITYNNISTNGEVEFYNVMKKMIPDNNGTVLDSLNGPNNPTFVQLSYTFNGFYNLPGDASNPIDHSIEHSIEDFNNLGVVVWVQDVDTKYILQSTEANLTATNISDEKDFTANIFPNPASDFIHLKLSSNINNNISIKIFNVLGEQVLNKHLKESQLNKSIISLRTQGLVNGLYNVVITDSKENRIVKKINIIK